MRITRLETMMSLDEAKPEARRPQAARPAGLAANDRPGRAVDPLADEAVASPSKTFRLPSGKTLTLFTDRVRARPAVTPQVSFLLGQNALGLGIWGLFAPRGVNRFLGLQCSPQTTRMLFGAREAATGAALFSDPTRAGVLWARVAGDAFDIAVLGKLNRPDNPKRRNARLALGIVLAVTVLDLIAATRMTNVKRNGA